MYSSESFSEFEDIQRDIQQQEEGGDYYEEPDKAYFNCFNDDDEDDDECYYNYNNSSSSSSSSNSNDSNDSKSSKNRSSLKKPFTALEENKETEETEENSSLSIDVDYDDWSNFCVKLPTQPFTFGKEKVSYKRRVNKRGKGIKRGGMEPKYEIYTKYIQYIQNDCLKKIQTIPNTLWGPRSGPKMVFC